MAAVLIPVYKEQPAPQELLSLTRCLEILGGHPIIFVAPVQLNMAQYRAACDRFGLHFKAVRFKDHYFEGIAGYNKLMLSAGFYKTFLDYQYILIYQLDAYVFRDELAYWCSKGYDFIGAPHMPHENHQGEMQFLKGYSRLLAAVNRVLRTGYKVSNVGNGGLSLRKTKTCYRLLSALSKKVIAWGTNNEDGFFKYWGNLLRPLFSLPPDDVALRFSIEQSPSASLKKLGGRLPFGCHAFEKYEPATWEKHIYGGPSINQST
ncbi:DUF5672 family protein [Mucilaginibacter angelicae]|uniref:DUF5672 family protein n=1 Tax=Mucilaginibacter angelicae TaxID=869718 RepID=A0ABV6L567_9SPHI